METIGRIICYNLGRAPAKSWHCSKHIGINRLYYIHSGTGGYIHGGQKYEFHSSSLYYIPYSADFTPFCDEADPIVHTYIDFELIPPIISNEVISMESGKSDKIASAVAVFNLGGKASNPLDLSPLYEDSHFWELCKASIIYLVNEIVAVNQIPKITDEIVIKSLEIMHTRMNERLTVNDIARECYMNPDSFIRRFTRTVGITPRAYLKNIRLRTAICLKASGMNLSQIASKVGYSDASALSHALQSL